MRGLQVPHFRAAFSCCPVFLVPTSCHVGVVPLAVYVRPYRFGSNVRIQLCRYVFMCYVLFMGTFLMRLLSTAYCPVKRIAARPAVNCRQSRSRNKLLRTSLRDHQILSSIVLVSKARVLFLCLTWRDIRFYNIES